MTTSETEALLLEQSLIKAEQPRFNVVLRDDKSYPFIELTDHPFPRLAFHRGAKKGGRYFGPFPSAAGRARTASTSCRDSSAFVPARDGFFKNRSRPCLQHQIDRCSAPCGRPDRPRAVRGGCPLGGHVPRRQEQRRAVCLQGEDGRCRNGPRVRAGRTLPGPESDTSDVFRRTSMCTVPAATWTYSA